MANKNLETISAVLDSEATEQEVEHSLAQIQEDASSKATFGRYSMIGDVLRNEQFVVAESSFADGIQQAIADVAQDSISSELLEPNVTAISAHPKWHQRITNAVQNLAKTNTGRGISQMAIAASVALVAVIGVNNMSVEEQQGGPIPVVDTVPLGGGIQPVSYSSAQPQGKLSADQVTQSRINSLIADHNQQLRAVSDVEDEVETQEDLTEK